MIALPLLSFALFAPVAAPSGATAVDSAAVYADTLPDAWAPYEWVAADALSPALAPTAAGAPRVHLLTRTITFTLRGTLGVHFPAGAPTAAFTLNGLELRNDRDSLVSAVYPAADAPATDRYALRVPTAGAYTLLVYGHGANGAPSSAPTAVRYTLTAPDPSAVVAPHLQPSPTAAGTATYDLSGRRVTTTAPHGIVIRGGRKMMR